MGSGPKELASQASQAILAKDHAKARSLLEQAVRAEPDFAEGWVGLGNACALLMDTPAARKSYERAVRLHAERYRMTPRDAGQLQQQAYVLLLLGRETEARDLLAQGMKSHPGDQQLDAFSKVVDGLLSDKEFQRLRVPQR